MRRVWLLVLLVLGLGAAPARADVRPFGLTCATTGYGVRFCQNDGAQQRVPSWDGVPLDVDVTLPATGDAPFPTLTMLHGYGDTKTRFESTDPNAGDHYNNVWFAKHGYAVVNYTVRGFGASCGTAASRQGTPACDKGWFHLGDQRYDARDAQYLLGLLVDSGVADPKRLGSTGLSLGSLTSAELSILNDRIRLPDLSYARWTSPKGTPLKFAAIFVTWSVTSLLDLAAPNGRFLDGEVPSPTQEREPIGPFKLSFPALALATGPAFGYVAPLGADPHADFFGWFSSGLTSDPGNPQFRAVANELGDVHQSAGMKIDGTVAPLLIEAGWVDDIVNGPTQALRLYNLIRGQVPNAPVSLIFSAVGHGRSANPLADSHQVYDIATAFLDHYMKGAKGGPAPGAVTAMTIGCPAGTPFEGPFTARDWGALAAGAVRFGSTAPGTVSSVGGDPTIAADLDPVANGTARPGHPCQTYQATDAPGTTAIKSAPARQSYVVLGRPTITAQVAEQGSWGQLIGRLWDLAPDGRQVLITRGVYGLTPGQAGRITWQLNGNGYRVAAGHVLRLELLGTDAPYVEPAVAPFSVKVSDIGVEVPTREAPDGAGIVAPQVNHTATVATPKTCTITVRTGTLRRPRVSVNGRRVKVRKRRARVVYTPGKRAVIRVVGRAKTGKTIRRKRIVRRCPGT